MNEGSSTQRWAAPRETSSAMVLSPAGESVVGNSERLSVRPGMCAGLQIAVKHCI